MTKRKDNGWKRVTTVVDHPCCECGQLITAGTTCASRSVYSPSTGWTSLHRCPCLSCKLPPAEREALLAPRRPKQESLPL